MRTPCPSGKPASARPRWKFRQEIRRLGPRPAAEETEERDRRLRPRRACLEPRRRAGAEDELPPPHSITASERARSVGGIVRPRDFAVLRLVADSNFVGCCAPAASGGASAAPPRSAQKSRRLMCSLAVGQYGRRLRPSVPRSHALQSGETRRPLTFKGKARPPEESGLLVHGRWPKHLPSQPKDHAPTGAGLRFRSTIRSEPMSSIQIVRGYFLGSLDSESRKLALRDDRCGCRRRSFAFAFSDCAGADAQEEHRSERDVSKFLHFGRPRLIPSVTVGDSPPSH